MTDPRLARMAETIVRYSLGVRAGQLVLIVTEPAGFPLAREVSRHVLAAGANPCVRTQYAELDELVLRSGSDAQAAYVPDADRLDMERADCRLNIRAPENTRAMAGVDPARQALAKRSRQALFNLMLERKGRGELATCVTQYPTSAAAQEAGLSLAQYEDFVFHACFVDRADPVGAWQALSAGQQRYVERLNRAGRVRIEAEDTDLELSVVGRKWVNSDGRANFPSGEVFTGPVEDSAQGHIRFDVPATYSGNPVQGIELEFEHGRVTKARADRGGELLSALLDTDEGARFLGEFAFGTNYGIDRPTGNILFDEKIGGTIHLAVGSGYPETGSRNKSGIHWDMIKDMRRGRVLADGELIYEDGKFR